LIPDNCTLASGSKDQQIRLWNVATGRCIKTQAGHSDVITAIAYSSPLPKGGQGGILATGSDDHTIKLWNAETRHWCSLIFSHKAMLGAG
jgi:WD40 repeat protein